MKTINISKDWPQIGRFAFDAMMSGCTIHSEDGFVYYNRDTEKNDVVDLLTVGVIYPDGRCFVRPNFPH